MGRMEFLHVHCVEQRFDANAAVLVTKCGCQEAYSETDEPCCFKRARRSLTYCPWIPWITASSLMKRRAGEELTARGVIIEYALIDPHMNVAISNYFFRMTGTQAMGNEEIPES